MLPVHVALVSESGQTTPAQMAGIAQALQTQVLRDFSSIWGVSASVAYFPELKDIPIGAWPVIVKDNIEAPGAAGFHTDENNQPYALVQYSETLSLTVSHETLEMLADPQGNRTHAGASPQDEHAQVQFLVEVCDPCEDASCAYSIEGVLVSDFITPNFYDPVQVQGTRYSFTGAIPAPRQILQGGYISYIDPATNAMWQEKWFGGPEPTFEELQAEKEEGQSLREWIDRNTPHQQLESGAPSSIDAVAYAARRSQAIAAIAQARAQNIAALIA